MPIPFPKFGEEDQRDFMSRCVLDPDIIENFPMEGERVSVCYKIWRENQ